MRAFSFFILVLSFAWYACSENSTPKKNADIPEAIEDSVQLHLAFSRQALIKASIHANLETTPVVSESGEDAADDPAIWVNRKSPSESLVFGSNKKGGLVIYDLQGKEVAFYPLGNVNNIDVLSQVPRGDSTIDILGFSNRSCQCMQFFEILTNPVRVVSLTPRSFPVDSSKIDDIYGFCFATDLIQGKNYVLINGKNGWFQQFELDLGKDKNLSLNLKREIPFNSQTEGMVSDSDLGLIYIGEENRGIWKISVSPNAGEEPMLLKESTEENPNIAYDIEGLALYKGGTTQFLAASIQGNFSYALFEHDGENRYLKSFKIVASESVDGVEETDGIDIVWDSLSPSFPKGLMVAQDGFNTDGDEPKNQNFKYISVEEILKLLR